MDPLPADQLIFEITADGAALLQRGDVGAGLGRIGRIGAFEIDGQREIDGVGNPPRIGEHIIERHLFAVAEPRGVADGMAAGGERFRARRRNCPGAADVPDIVEHDRIARHVQRGERVERRAHQIRSG